MEKETNIIVCPYCGQEYLPSEIFLPKTFFGEPKDIFKTEFGKIDYFMGTPMCLTESYICDNCNKEFHVQANLSFNTSYDTELDEFSDEYVSTIDKKAKIILPEGDLF